MIVWQAESTSIGFHAGLNDHTHAYLGELEDCSAAASSALQFDVGTRLTLPVIVLGEGMLSVPRVHSDEAILSAGIDLGP